MARGDPDIDTKRLRRWGLLTIVLVALLVSADPVGASPCNDVFGLRVCGL